MFWFLTGKSKVKKLEGEIKSSFDSVKQDFDKVGKWIDHFDGKKESHEKEIEGLKDAVSTLQKDFDELKGLFSFFGQGSSKQPPTVSNKQAQGVYVQSPVQTGVQTSILSNLTTMERVIVWALLNSDMRLSHDDLSALLGKSKSTIRGQINSIKQKSEGLIRESKESNGKKRLYIPDQMREIVVKSVKVRVDKSKKYKKTQKSEVIAD